MSRLPAVHGLTGRKDYDAVLISEVVHEAEAGLGIFHTHGEGMSLMVERGGRWCPP